jgi:hypothetical protein
MFFISVEFTKHMPRTFWFNRRGTGCCLLQSVKKKWGIFRVGKTAIDKRCSLVFGKSNSDKQIKDTDG